MKASDIETVETAAQQAGDLLAAFDNAPGSAASAGLTTTDVEMLRRFSQHENPLTLALKELGAGRIKRSDVEALYSRAQVEGRAIQPIVLRLLLQAAAMPEEGCPYNVPVLKFLAKGFGMVSPNKPVDLNQRAREAKRAADLSGMSTAKVIDAVLEGIADTRGSDGP